MPHAGSAADAAGGQAASAPASAAPAAGNPAVSTVILPVVNPATAALPAPGEPLASQLSQCQLSLSQLSQASLGQYLLSQPALGSQPGALSQAASAVPHVSAFLQVLGTPILALRFPCMCMNCHGSQGQYPLSEAEISVGWAPRASQQPRCSGI